MSGPINTVDASPNGAPVHPEVAAVEVTESRAAHVGEMRVRRALPRRGRRTVGAWCFADHLGPATVTEDGGLDIGPHPHIGLQTVTWLLAGEVVHRDSLGSEQRIRPGQLNLMTAGHGVSHSEQRTGRYRGELHGVQLWVAQPEATRHDRPAFEHHGDLPMVDIDGAAATVLVGDFDGAGSPARRDTAHVGVDLEIRPGDVVLPLDRRYEYALVVLAGSVSIDARHIEPGHLAYLGEGREECRITADGDACRALLIGGVPFEEPIVMWWNYVARTREEISRAHQQWMGDDERFGTVRSSLSRMRTAPPPWLRT